MDYDIIGDIHGQFGKLQVLLARLGYQERQGAWRHPERTAIFVGDFIDRGPQGVETVQAVRAMVDAGSALAVMGNHELNAVAWHTPDTRYPGEYLRPRLQEPWGPKNRHQHRAFLAQVESDPALHAELVEWFLTLPLWIDLGDLRIVHACWHPPSFKWLVPRLREGCFLTPQLLVDATTEPAAGDEADDSTSSIFRAVETLTKGIEIPLPAPHGFCDKDGIRRTRVRQRWWDCDATTYRTAAMLPPAQSTALPDVSLPESMQPPMLDDVPTFFGHYWMTGSPRPQSTAAVCVDYSAGNGGPLAAYRWCRGEPLDACNFVTTQ